ncbi:MAG: hypothetical protein ABEJ91_03870 [Candidatus Nanohaloarchaea archaeon]
MKVLTALKEKFAFLGRKNEYELDEEWEEILRDLRNEIADDGFDLEENEELYISILAHVVRENKEGLEMLANEEVAEKARMGEDTSIDDSASVQIKTIRPQKPDSSES